MSRRLFAKKPGTTRRNPVLQWLLFVALVVLGVVFLQSFVFRVYSVVGSSMEPTFFTGHRLVVNKVPRTVATISGRSFVPQRGEIVVFKNPLYGSRDNSEEYLVKRVIGLPGERVVVKDGNITVYNSGQPQGFNPDDGIDDVQKPTNGNVDRLVPTDEIFVAGDNRLGNHSLDSRNGLSTLPVREVEGVVFLQVFPFDKIRLF